MHMRSFASALGPYGFTFNAVATGIILTDITREALERPVVPKKFQNNIPTGRIGHPRTSDELAFS